ncbi:tRNA (guanine-N(7)-)-methyltransferase [Aquisphaera giovannonii]|uniref:tRNA (guanine-N(7)-)-methyltransferase n=1 Tax=Aquisphaera giovannonii TaxID=406548 RepID=A0A5B9VZ96_9BACT|nr:tRNA (guanosine(46)-N7)-methyltransferase TrmB [Aquisphaera giovannonii]QEH33736.1 tRNA (guanine-N(7)-)-methyltransferase [Aquisphaera giovannonii]
MTRARPSLDVSSCLLEPERFSPDACLNWNDLFGDGREVEMEIGSGKGLFLVNAAAANPDRGFFGIEISKKYARLAAERAVKAGVANVRLWPGDARPVVGRLVPDASVAAVHVYFPDPWWKKRHKKRRVFTGSLVESIVRILKPGGRLEVVTDVEEYFEVMRELLASEERLLEQPSPAAKEPEHDLDYLTNFERKFRIEGRPIHRASYRKAESPGPALR